MKRYLSPEQAADHLCVTAETVRVMCRKGEIPAVKVRNLLRIPEDGLEAYLAARPASA